MQPSELKGGGGREDKGSSSDDAVKLKSFDLCPIRICIPFLATAAAPQETAIVVLSQPKEKVQYPFVVAAIPLWELVLFELKDLFIHLF